MTRRKGKTADLAKGQRREWVGAAMLATPMHIIAQLFQRVNRVTRPLRVHVNNMGMLAVVRELLHGPLWGFVWHFILGEGGECPGCYPDEPEWFWMGEQERAELTEAGGGVSWLTST